MISKNMSPLNCCNPTGDRQNMNPVFKQQYVNEGGQIKMKVPISPMHYISKASFYTHDDRFPMRLEPNYPYYNERIHNNTRNYEFDYKNDLGKRLITPSVSFVTQPRRNMSAQIIDNSQQSPNHMTQILRSIDEKLSRIEFMCRTNEDDIKEIIQMLKPNQKMESDSYQTKARLILKDNIEGPSSKTLEKKLNTDDKNKKSPDGISNKTVKRNETKYFDQKDQLMSREKEVGRLLTHHSLLNISPEVISRADDKMFDISDDLKNSNDMLERYIRGVKFGELADLESKLDVLSSDFAEVKVINDPDETQIPEEKEPEDSLMANIESKFKKLFSRFDSKSSEEPQNEPEDWNIPENGSEKESLALFEGFKGSEKSEKEESLKLINQEIKPNDQQNPQNINVKLSKVDMITLLKGIDLPSRIKEVNLTMDELLFLKGLNQTVDPEANDAKTQDRESLGDRSEGQQSSDTEPGFKCNLLAPTRVDFTSVIRDDSIHGLNSSTFD